MTPLQPAQRFCGFVDCRPHEIPPGKAFLCGRCKAVYFCNKECQKKAWKVHRTVCQEFINTTLSIQVTTQDGKTNETTKPVRILRTQGAPNGFQKAIGRVQVKPGSTVSFKSGNDAVGFSSSFSPKLIQELKREYQGLKNFKDEFLKQSDYVSIMKCLWTEDDLDAKIKWLLGYAERGHPLLMLELSRALAQRGEKSGYSKKTAHECMKWYVLGLHCTLLDISCNNDPSTSAAFTVLKYNYGEFLKQAIKTLGDDLETFRETVFKEWNPSQLQSSPLWVTFHGMSKYLGSVSVINQDQWAETRLKKHYEMIQKYKAA